MATKRILFLFFLGFIIPFGLFGQRYWVASSSGNWSNPSNWSTTSGGSGGASVPTAADAVIFNGSGGKNGNCVITSDVSVASFSMTGYTGQITVSSSDLIITGTATFNTGQMVSSGTGSTATVNSSATTSFAGTTFSIPLTVSSTDLFFNGSTFNSSLTATKTGGGANTSTGGNTFNGTTSVTNASLSVFTLANTNPDRYNSTVTFTTTTSGRIFVGGNSIGNQFNGNIIVNSTGNSGITFNATGGSSTLAFGKTLSVGATGFTSGVLSLYGFTQTGTTANSITLTGSSQLIIGSGTVFNGNLSVVSPMIYLNGAQFNGITSFEKSGAGVNYSTGGNTFNGLTTIKNSGPSSFILGNGGADIFNADISLVNTGSGGIWVAFAGLGHKFNGNINIESTSGIGIAIGTGTSVLASGKTFQIGSSGFTSGTFTINGLTQTGSTPVNLTFTGSSAVVIGTGTTFNANVSIVAPTVFLNGAQYNSTASFEKTGPAASNGTGGNTFNGSTTLKNSSSNNFILGNGAPDIFNANVSLINASSGGAYTGVAFSNLGHQFNGNISVESTSGGGVQIGPGSATLASGRTISVGAGGFSTGWLYLDKLTQLGTTNQNLTLSGTAGLFIRGGSVFNGDVSFVAYDIALAGATYNGSTYFEKTGVSSTVGAGSNTFNGATTLKCSNSGLFGTGQITADIFNGDLSLITTGSSGRVQVAANSSGNQFNGNVSLESNSTGGITIGPGLSTLASGKSLQAGAGGFSSGYLDIWRLTQLGTSPINLNMTGSAALYVQTGSVFNSNVSFIVPSLYLNGATYNGSAYFEKTGAGVNSGIGGNTFNGAVTIKNSGSNTLGLGNGSPEIFNSTVALINANTGNGYIHIGTNSTGTQFNENVTVESTTGGGIDLASSTLAAGKTVSLGASGFSAGFLYFEKFTQVGTTPLSLTLTGSAGLFIQGGSIFNGSFSATAPYISLSGATFNGLAFFEKTGPSGPGGTGGNQFNGVTTLKVSGTGSFVLGGLSADIFNNDVSLISAGAAGVELNVAAGGTGHQFNGNITIESTSGGGVRLGRGASTLAAGKIIQKGAAGFSTGNLIFQNFTHLGTTPLNLTLTGTAGLIFGSSVFNADVTFFAPAVLLNGATFNGVAYFQKTGGSLDYNSGGNTFNAATTLKNSASGIWVLANGSPDKFVQDVTFDNAGSGRILVAYNSNDNTFGGDIILQSTAGGGIDFCSSPASTAILSSGKLRIGPSGFSAGSLNLPRFTQLGTQASTLTLTGGSSITLGPSTLLNAAMTTTAPGVYLSGTIFNSDCSITKTGSQNTRGAGNNVFNGLTSITNTGTGYLQTSGSNVFNANVTLSNSSTSNLTLEISSGSVYDGQLTLTNQGSGVINVGLGGSTSLNENVLVNATGGSIAFSTSVGSTSTLASGKTVSIGGTGFSGGELWFAHFTQSGTTSQNLTLGSNATFRTGPLTTWNGSVNFSAGRVFLDGAQFFAPATISKTSVGTDRSVGGNSFFDQTTINVSSSTMILAGTNGDDFVGNLTFNLSQSAKVYPALIGTTTISGNLSALNFDGSAVDLNFGSIANGGAGSVTFNGSADQAISANFTPTITRMIMDKSSGAVNLNIPINIAASATFTSGVVNSTSTNFINFANDAVANGGSTASFVNGPVRKTGNDPFTFPTGVVSGGSGYYRPVSMSAPSGTNDLFVAQYFKQPQVFGGVSTYQSPIVAVGACEYFSFTRSVGASSPKLTLSWLRSDCASDLFTNDLSKYVVSRWTGSNWINQGSSATTGDASSGTITSNAVTGFGNFAIGYTGILSNNLSTAACSGSAIGFVPESDAPGATYSWSRATVAGITPGSTTGTGAISEILTNSTLNSIVVTYQIVTSTASASSAAETVTVTLKPAPSLTSTLVAPPVCSSTAFAYNPTSSLSGTTFTWSRSGITGISQAANTGSGSVNEQLNNTTVNPISVPYDYTLTANGCSTSQTVTVTVNPTPQLNSTLTPPGICSTNAIAYTESSATTGSSFTWTRASVTGITQAASSGAGSINEQLTNSTPSPITVSYVVITSANGCNNGPSGQTVSIIVNPTPQLTSTLAPSAICSNNVFEYTPTSLTSGVTYSWSRASVLGISQPSSTGTGAISEPLTNTTITSVNAVYNVTLSANGCTNNQLVTASVKPLPALTSVLSPAAICSSTTFAYTPVSSLSGTTFAWTRPAVSGISQSAGSGTGSVSETITNTTSAPVSVAYNYTLSANGCSAPQAVTVIVNPTPQLNSSLAPPAICSGSTFAYTFSSATAGATYAWTRASVTGINESSGSGTASVSEQLTNSTIAPVSVPYVVITSANGCNNGTAGQTVTVVVNPTPQLSSTLTAPAICSNTAFTYAPASSTASTTYSWNRASILGISQAGSTGTGSVSEQLTNTTTSPVTVTYNFTLSANGCTNVQNVTTLVNPSPVLSSATNPSAICSSTPFVYSPTSSVPGTTFSWNRAVLTGISEAGTAGTGSINEQLTNTTVNPISVIYNYLLTANGCSNPQSVTVPVNPTPVLSSSLAPPAICSSASFVYSLSSTTSGASFAWSRPSVTGINEAGSNGTSAINEQLTNSTSGSVTVPYVVITSANGCNNGPTGQTISVVVNPTPQLSSSLSPSAVCSNTVFSYAPTSLTTGTTYSWSRPAVAGISQSAGTGTGSINEQLNNTTNAPVSVVYNYTLNANSCSAPQAVTVVINPTPQLSSSLAPGSICSGSTFSYSFSSNTTGASYSWSRTSVNGLNEPASAGTSSINEQLTNSTANRISVPYVVISSANGCNNGPSGQIVTVFVDPAPQLSSSLTPGAICSTNMFGYTPTSATAGTGFSWSRSAISGISQPASGGTGSISEPLTNISNNTIDVVYDFTLTANGCSKSQQIAVAVHPTPALTSLINPAAICSATTFDYTPSSSITGATYSWSRPAVAGISESSGAGVGAVSEQLNNITSAPVSVIYNYNVTANGCNGSQSITVVVNPTPKLSSSLTPPAICSGSTMSYAFSSATSGATYTWTRASIPGLNEGPSNGTASISEQLTSSTTSPVTVPYVVVTSANGCNNGPSGQIVSLIVNPSPQLSSSLAAPSICSNNTFTYTPTSVMPGTSYSWSRASVTGISQSASTGTGSISEQLVNTSTSPVSVNYTFTLAASGCSNIQTVTTTVNPTPALSSVLAPAAICSNTLFAYTPTSSVTGTAFSWSRPGVQGIGEPAESGIGPVAEQLTNTSFNPVSVIYNYTLTANGCSAPAAITVVVNPVPGLSLSLNAPAICSGSSVIYNFTSGTAGATYAWSRAAVTGINEAATNGTSAINEQLTNSTTAAIEVSYVVITSANGCNNGPDGETVSITVNPTPELTSASSPAAICSGTNFSYTPSTLPQGTTYSWTRPNITGIKEGLSSSSGSINEVLTNQTAQTLNVAYNFVLLANGCSKNQSITVTVNPNPVLSSSLAQTICSGDLMETTLTTETPGAIFSWSRGVVSGISQGANTGSGSQLSEVLTNTTLQRVKVPYTVTASVNGCSNAGELLEVIVNPRPTLSSALSEAICSGDTFNYTPTSLTGGTIFTWSRGAKSGIMPLTSNGQADISETLTNSTGSVIHVNYSIVPSFSGCEGTTASLDLKIGAIPTVTTTSPAAICPDQRADLTASGITVGSDLGLQYFYFTDSDLTIPVSDPASVGEGTYYVQGKNADGCVQSSPVTITFKVVGELTSNLEHAATCSPATFNYVPTASLPNSTFTWTRLDNVSIAEDPVTGGGEIHEATLTNTSQSTAVVKYVVITSTNQCSNLGDTVKLPVFPIPVLSSSLDAGTVSNGDHFIYEPASLVSGSSFEWSRPTVTGILEAGSGGIGGISEFLHNTTPTPIEIRYSITATANGCIGPEQFVTLMVGPYETVKIPEGFSPNGDGINDTFEIVNTSGFPSEVRIFDRWGKLIYSNDNYQNDWSGAALPDGTYYSVVKVGKFLKKHALTIHR